MTSDGSSGRPGILAALLSARSLLLGRLRPHPRGVPPRRLADALARRCARASSCRTSPGAIRRDSRRSTIGRPPRRPGEPATCLYITAQAGEAAQIANGAAPEALTVTGAPSLPHKPRPYTWWLVRLDPASDLCG